MDLTYKIMGSLTRDGQPYGVVRIDNWYDQLIGNSNKFIIGKIICDKHTGFNIQVKKSIIINHNDLNKLELAPSEYSVI